MSLEDVFSTDLPVAIKQIIEDSVRKIIQCVIDGNSDIPVDQREYVGITEPIGLKPHLQIELYYIHRKLIKEGLTESQANVTVTFTKLRDYTLQKMHEAAERGAKIPKVYLGYIAVVTIA